MVPFILGIGGTTRPNSSTEKAIRVCLKVAAANGAETLLLGAADLQLALYEWENQTRTKEAARLVEEARRADGIVLASPGYHGTISGLIKNAVDYVEDMNKIRGLISTVARLDVLRLLRDGRLRSRR
jgi:FMN reductase